MVPAVASPHLCSLSSAPWTCGSPLPGHTNPANRYCHTAILRLGPFLRPALRRGSPAEPQNPLPSALSTRRQLVWGSPHQLCCPPCPPTPRSGHGRPCRCCAPIQPLRSCREGVNPTLSTVSGPSLTGLEVLCFLDLGATLSRAQGSHWLEVACALHTWLLQARQDTGPPAASQREPGCFPGGREGAPGLHGCLHPSLPRHPTDHKDPSLLREVPVCAGCGVPRTQSPSVSDVGCPAARPPVCAGDCTSSCQVGSRCWVEGSVTASPLGGLLSRSLREAAQHTSLLCLALSSPELQWC